MTDFVPVTLTDQVATDGGSAHLIHFRPGNPGLIGIRSVPADSKAHAESGFLGILELLRPGTATPVVPAVKVKSGQPWLALSYTATAADLATSGDWTCRVTNETDVKMAFTNDIVSPGTIPVQRASFDIGLLNLIFAEAVAAAAIHVHLASSESKDDKASVISVAPTVAEALNRPDLVDYRFHIDDVQHSISVPNDLKTDVIAALLGLGVELAVAHAIIDGNVSVTLRIVSLDSGGNVPIVSVATNPLALQVYFRFADGGTIVSPTFPVTVTVNSLAVALTLGFDGTVTVECDTSATLSIGPYSDDVSATLKDAIEQKFKDELSNPDLAAVLGPAALKAGIEKFVIALMRLRSPAPGIRAVFGVTAHVLRYGVEQPAAGPALAVDYYTVPIPPVVEPTR